VLGLEFGLVFKPWFGLGLTFSKIYVTTRNTFCGTRYLSHCHAIWPSSCVSAFDALVNLQPILSLNKNGWLP